MSYFTCDQNLKIDEVIEISGEEARHILLSRRIKLGEEIKLQGADSRRFLTKVEQIEKKSLKVLIQKELVVAKEPGLKVSLCLPFVSEQQLDFVFQKSTELGVTEIILFNSKNTAFQISKDKFEAKFARWQKILKEAAKQSERTKTPTLVYKKSLQDVLLVTKEKQEVFLCDEQGVSINSIKLSETDCFVYVGPEGGFTEQEKQQILENKNCKKIKLSNFVLKAETAAIASASVLLNKK